MRSEAAVVDAVAKYFFFCCLDEQQSFAASLRVLSELKSHNWLDDAHRAQWVKTLAKWRSKAAQLRPRPWSADESEKGFQLAADFDRNSWVSFLSSAESSEVEAVLFSRILSFSDEEIASGLGVSVGTVRYRVGRGLRHLGGYLES